MIWRRKWIGIVVLASGLGLAACGSGTNSASSTTTTKGSTGLSIESTDQGVEGGTEQVTPVIASVISPGGTTAVKGSDGQYHVVYELQLTNATGGSASLTSLTVRNATSDSIVTTMTGETMVKSESLRLFDRQAALDATLPAGAGRVLIVSLDFPTLADVPTGITNQLSVVARDPLSSSETPKEFSYDVADVPLTGQQPPVLSPPLEGNGWIASDGCCNPAISHLSAVIPVDNSLVTAESFAVDWIKADANGRVVNGDPKILTNWVGYGANVIAVNAGVVTEVRDDLPDQVPGARGDLALDAVPGNRVVENLGGGIYAVYAHLKPGSVHVTVGQPLAVGQTLGQLGNSGGSIAPHLHFHLVFGPSVTSSNGFPYVLNSFQMAGQVNLSKYAEAVQGKAQAFEPSGEPVAHQNELPIGYTVVNFPGGS
jgi:Peptidase family M23